MSNPRTKRQFAGAASDPTQRQITSFFGPRSSAPPSDAPSNSSQPALPASVQANLLSVGMRVRKSVPEGYKTGGYSSFKLWTDNDELAPLRTVLVPSVAQRELLPFCGINKIGGMASQPVREDDVPSLDSLPGLSSSQESMDSTTSDDLPRSRKRIFNDEDASEAPLRLWQDRDAWLEGEVSPRSLAPVGWGNARPMAMPRKNRQKARVMNMETIGQENLMVDDFEDAEFLVAEDMDVSDV